MNKVAEILRQWIEVWPLLIPLSIVIFLGSPGRNKIKIVWYLILAFIASSLAIVTWLYGSKIPGWTKNNGIFYNIHSILRTTLLGWYIYQLKQVKQYKYPIYILIAYAGFALINFLFFTSITNLDVHLFAAESIALLILCLTYYLSTIYDDEDNISFKNPAFLICTGISLYEAVSFFIYLFLFKLSLTNFKLGVLTFNISQYSFVVFCILIGQGLYQSAKPKKKIISQKTATPQPQY